MIEFYDRHTLTEHSTANDLGRTLPGSARSPLAHPALIIGACAFMPAWGIYRTGRWHRCEVVCVMSCLVSVGYCFVGAAAGLGHIEVLLHLQRAVDVIAHC